MIGRSKFGFSLLLFLSLMMGGISTVQAVQVNCSEAPYNGVIDGTIYPIAPANVKLDTNCTIKNYPAPTGMNTNFSFDNNDPTPYLIIFDNVYHTGQMSCNVVAGHKVWFVNGASSTITEGCQSIVLLTEKIDKQNPAGQTTAAVGVPFTYTLTIPVMYDQSLGTVLSTGSPDDISTIAITDDLTVAGTADPLNAIAGAELSLVSATYSVNGGPSVDLGIPAGSKLLNFSVPDIPAGSVVTVDLTVVLDDVPANAPGVQFRNKAEWDFWKGIDVDDSGTIDVDEFFNLPGEAGETQPLTIAVPDLVVTKSSTETNINLITSAPFTIDVQNIGGVTAWGAIIEDLLPTGMCSSDPVTAPGFNVVLALADGTPWVALINGTHYTATYAGCLLTVTLADGIPIYPTERLIISYQGALDPGYTLNAEPLTNVAAAVQWHGANQSDPFPFRTYNRTRTDGTPGTVDHEDSYTITTALTGYYFQKTVENLTTGVSPATTAVPGDRLRYRLRIYNADQIINNVVISDVLDPALFDTSTFFAVTPIAPGATYTFVPGSGLLTIQGILPLFPLNIPIGSEIVMEFEINLASPLANGTVVPNQAFMTFDNQSPPPATITTPSDNPNVNGIAGPGDPADTTDILIQSPGALLKANTQATATIGEQFSYTITVPQTPVNVPLYDVRITDDLSASGADLQFVSASVVSGGPWVLTNTGTATSLVIEDTATGIDIPANSQAVIQVTVQLNNSLINQNTVTFNNTANYTYNRINGVVGSQTPGQPSTTANMTVVEPHISSITKVADNVAPPSGSTITYSVTLAAQGGAGYSDVFDVSLVDNLDLGLTYVLGSASVTVGAGVAADNVIGDPDIVGDGVTTPQTLSWDLNNSDIDIVAGTSVTISYSVQLSAVLAGTTLSNTAVAQWTSLDGSSVVERNGSNGIGGLNDYITASVIETVTTPGVTATISKTRNSDTYGAGDDNVRIGDIVDYELRLTLSEGTFGNLVLVDTLPQGLKFEGIVSINSDTGPAPYIAVAPFIHADITAASVVEAGDATTGPTTVTWSPGSITNQPNNGLSDDFIIVYRARVLNNVLPQSTLSIPLNNTVDMSYATAIGTVTQSDNDTIITALQPQLTVSKSAAPAGGDTSIDAGELVNYTVDIVNSGTAPAYDVVLQDIIPAGMRNGAATVTIISSDLVSVAGYAPLAPTYNAVTGVATWNFDTGVADAYTIPAGDTLRVVYQVQADAVLGGGLTLSNAATAMLYYSFDDEAVPTAGTVTGVREIYGPSNTASTTLYTGSLPTKALVSPAAAAPYVTIGEEVVYQITVPGTVSSTTLYDVQITDTLDPNLEFVSATVTGGIGVTDTSIASQMNIVVAEIPAGQQAVIELRTRVPNIASAQEGVAINNTVSYTFAYTSGGATQSALTSIDIVTVTVTEPLVTMTKAVSNVTDVGQPPTAGDILRYTLTLTASGGAVGDNFSDVFDASIEDSLSLGLAYSGNPTVTGAGNTIAVPVVTGDGITVAQNLNWSLADGNADIDITEGTAVIVSYDVVVLNGVLAGQVLSNSAVARWTGLDGINANERNGTGVPPLNDYFTAPATTSQTVPDNNIITKAIVSETFGAVDGNVRIGDIIDYELRVNLQEGLTGAVSLVDTLPQGLQFEEVVSVNGDTLAPYSSVAPFTHANIGAPVVAGDATTGPTTVTWSIGDVINAGDNDPTNNDYVIIYRARVLNNVLAHVNSLVLSNNVDFTYTIASGTSTRSATANTTVQQPVLAVTKSVAPAGGDTVIDANELITYTVDINNTGAAPAYDTVLRDVIPVGLRNGAATITMVSTTLVNAAIVLPNIAPAYDPVTGIATWNFDSGVAGQYNIPGGDTLRVIYQVQADPTLSAGITMTNLARVQLYYSFDDDAVPTQGSVVGDREIYGLTNTATVTLTTAAPNPLSKQNPATTTVAVGDTFSYRITVPATPMTTALNDVRILDNLAASAADLGLVSITKISGSQPWTPVNTGTATDLVIEDTAIGIDIPAGEQIEIDITVVVRNTATNVPGLLFNNTATYNYNQINDVSSRVVGGSDITPDMQIVGPDSIIVDKITSVDPDGPIQMIPGVPQVFTLDIHNTGSGTAWDMTVTDMLPNPVPGGMCDTPPANITAQVFLADGVTPVSGVLVQGTDYTTSFVPGSPTCTLTFTMVSAAAAIPADNRLIISYEVVLDADNPQGASLINVAGATEWFSGDTAGAGATGQIYTYIGVLTNGTVGTLDNQDAYEVIAQSPIIQFQKTVANVTTGVNPAATATPGDLLRYSIVANNVSVASLSNFSVVDELDALNASPWFEPGSLTIVTVPATADTSNTDINGGANGTGLLDVRNLTLAADDGAPGGPDTVLIEFEVRLASVIPNSTIVLNQAQLDSVVTGSQDSNEPNINPGEDPAIPGDEVPTPITITSAPVLDVQKTSADITGDPASLAAGDTLRYTITVKNVAGEDSINTTLQDSIPVNTTYVANSTTLNGSPVVDPAPGVSALDAGMLINAPEDLTPGNMRADPDPAANNTATITFDVVVIPTAYAGALISNQGVVSGDGANGGVMPNEPTDDPATPADDDPTIDIVDVSGVGTLSGYAWHDADFDDTQDAAERDLEGWFVDVYQSGALINTTTTDAAGAWQITGLVANDNGGDPYEIIFRAPGANINSALLGLASSAFTNNLQRISDIVFGPDTSTPSLNLPIDPDGVVYGSVTRAPVAGATLTMVDAASGAVLPAECFDNIDNTLPQQQQVTLADGYYKFDIDFSNAGCSAPAGGNYVIRVTPPATGYNAAPSVLIPPVTDASTGAYSVPACSADAIAATAECEAQNSELAPVPAIAPGPGTNYYLHLTLDNPLPSGSQLFNNHIPLDPDLATAITITKTSSLVNVKRGDLVPYTITASNTLAGSLPDVDIVDTFPPGFRYVKGSARMGAVAAEPVINGQTLTWPNLVLNTNTKYVIKLLLVVGSGVSEGEYVNRANLRDNVTGQLASEATATVRVVPDPTFDCTDIIGKVFDDVNMNGYQDDGEKGIANARVVSARGLIMKTDEHGRFHITCAAVPNQDRGSNFILKLDERSLPSGYRVITENPRVQRATRGKMMKFNFGAAIHRVIRLDIADPVFEKGKNVIRLQWQPRLKLLINELGKGPAILRISYLGDTESSGLVDDRIDAIKNEINKLRDEQNCCDALTIETEIFWRRGGPPE